MSGTSIVNLGELSKPATVLIEKISDAVGRVLRRGLFTALCGFGWVIGNVIPLVYDVDHEIYGGRGITFASLIHLESIGLIQFNNLTGFTRTGLPERFAVLYYGAPVHLKMQKESDNSLRIGKVLLTKDRPGTCAHLRRVSGGWVL